MSCQSFPMIGALHLFILPNLYEKGKMSKLGANTICIYSCVPTVNRHFHVWIFSILIITIIRVAVLLYVMYLSDTDISEYSRPTIYV